MAKIRSNEILDKALASDKTVVPRFDIKDAQGSVLAANVTLTLKNPVIQKGMAVDKQAMDECLAASGAAYGTADCLVLEQQNFILFDGAPVLVRLPYTINGACTLNINNTGAKEIKTSSGDIPGDYRKDSWLHLVYSAAADQYIIVNATGGNTCSTNINLLEELQDMRYYKLVDAASVPDRKYISWLKDAILQSTCETTNYYWFMRVLPKSSTIDFMRISKDTGIEEELRSIDVGVEIDADIVAVNIAGGNAGLDMRRGTTRVQLVPVRNGDAALFALCYATYFLWNDTSTSLTKRGNSIIQVTGLIFKDGEVRIDRNHHYSSSSSGRDNLCYNASALRFSLMNGIYDEETDTIIYAGFDSTFNGTANSSSPAGPDYIPGIIYSVNASTHTQNWQYAGGKAAGAGNTNDYGRYVYIVSATEAVGFAGPNRNRSSASDASARYPAWYTKFTATTAPDDDVAIGDASNNQLGNPTRDDQYGTPFASGWCETKNDISLMSWARLTPNNRPSISSSYTCSYNKITLTKSADSEYTLSTSYLLNTTSDVFHNYEPTGCFYAGSPAIPLFTMCQTSLGGANFIENRWPYYLKDTVISQYPYTGTPVSFIDGIQNFKLPLLSISAISTYTNSVDSSPVKGMRVAGLDGTGLLAKRSGAANGDILTFVDENAYLYRIRLSTRMFDWQAPEPGIYKFILVGAGAAGTSSYGGGAGELVLAVEPINKDDVIHMSIGCAAAPMQSRQTTSDSGLIGLTPNSLTSSHNASDTIITSSNGIKYVAHAAQGNAGGGPAAPQGAVTENGGGAGGYDLTTYGGNGMNQPISSSTVSIPVQQKNGGTAAITGGVTSGIGYGAGGGMNLPGNDGCIVIIR